MQPYAISAKRYISEHAVRVAVGTGLLIALVTTMVIIVSTMDQPDAKIITADPVERLPPYERSSNDMTGSDGMRTTGDSLRAVQVTSGPAAVTFDDLRRFYDANHQPLPTDPRAPFSVSPEDLRHFYEANNQPWPPHAAPTNARRFGDPRLGLTE